MSRQSIFSSFPLFLPSIQAWSWFLPVNIVCLLKLNCNFGYVHNMFQLMNGCESKQKQPWAPVNKAELLDNNI